MLAVEVGAVAAFEAFGEAAGFPVGGFVAGALEAFDVGEGFGQEGAVAVFLLPMLRQVAQGQTHGAGGEVGHAGFGKHEEAAVLDDESEPFGALVGRPSLSIRRGRWVSWRPAPRREWRPSVPGDARSGRGCARPDGPRRDSVRHQAG